MTPPAFNPLGVRNWLANAAADIAPRLPDLNSVRVSIGSYKPAHCVSVSGFHNKDRRHLHFNGATIEEATVNAEKALATLSHPQPKR